MNTETIKARIWENGRGVIVEAQRGKYKHWFAIGEHAETDAAFKTALATGKLVWVREIVGPSKLF